MSGTVVGTNGHNSEIVVFDADRKARFLRNYRLTGQIQRSAQEAGISPSTVRQHIKEKPDFAEAVQEAYSDFKEAIESEIMRRAIMGWEEPVYQQGLLAGSVRKYDSRLLELLAKRHIPEYKEKFEHHHNIAPGILAVGKDPDSKQVWEEEHGVADFEELEDGTGKSGDQADAAGR